jgi:hypothetical protein
MRKRDSYALAGLLEAAAAAGDEWAARALLSEQSAAKLTDADVEPLDEEKWAAWAQRWVKRWCAELQKALDLCDQGAMTLDPTERELVTEFVALFSEEQKWTR